jgi:hypothetical protein
MACKGCKQKKEIMGEDKFQRRSNLVEKWVPWVLLFLFLFGIYGIFKFVELILSLFSK